VRHHCPLNLHNHQGSHSSFRPSSRSTSNGSGNGQPSEIGTILSVLIDTIAAFTYSWFVLIRMRTRDRRACLSVGFRQALLGWFTHSADFKFHQFASTISPPSRLVLSFTEQEPLQSGQVLRLLLGHLSSKFGVALWYSHPLGSS
jgi:hypothetical protein